MGDAPSPCGLEVGEGLCYDKRDTSDTIDQYHFSLIDRALYMVQWFSGSLAVSTR